MKQLQHSEVKPEHFYNKTQAAKLLGISRTTLRKYTELGRITMSYNPFMGKDGYSGKEIIKAMKSHEIKSNQKDYDNA